MENGSKRMFGKNSLMKLKMSVKGTIKGVFENDYGLIDKKKWWLEIFKKS